MLWIVVKEGLIGTVQYHITSSTTGKLSNTLKLFKQKSLLHKTSDIIQRNRRYKYNWNIWYIYTYIEI